jgi:hypothetical protein
MILVNHLLARVSTMLLLGIFSAGIGAANGVSNASSPASPSGEAKLGNTALADCVYAYTPPAVTGCDGVLLSDPQWSASRTAGIVATTTPNGLPALNLGYRQSIKLKNEGCLQLGSGGNDFSVLMWVKPPNGISQILSSGISPYGGAGGFVLHTVMDGGRAVLRMHTTSASGGPWLDFDSTPMDASAWAYVTVTYVTNGDGSFATITVNGVSRSGRVYSEPFSGESVAACNVALQGRRWKTADYFPGKVTNTLDATKTFTVPANATVPAVWGRPVAFATEPKIRVTGLYLPPGSVARVTVPQALVNTGFAVQIETYIETNRALFDVDRDGKTMALTDGVMILRRLLNPGASTTDAAAMAAITANAKIGSRADVDVVNAIDALRP